MGVLLFRKVPIAIVLDSCAQAEAAAAAVDSGIALAILQDSVL